MASNKTVEFSGKKIKLFFWKPRIPSLGAP